MINASDILLRLANMVGDELHAMGLPNLRFALVVWRARDPIPLFSTTNEPNMAAVEQMLVSSAAAISEIELYAGFGETVGNA